MFVSISEFFWPPALCLAHCEHWWGQGVLEGVWDLSVVGGWEHHYGLVELSQVFSGLLSWHWLMVLTWVWPLSHCGHQVLHLCCFQSIQHLSMCVTWCLHCASFVVGGQQAWDGDSWGLTLGPCGCYWPWPTTAAGGVIWGSNQWWGQGWWWWEASKQHGNGWQAISRFGLGWDAGLQGWDIFTYTMHMKG